MCRREIVEVLDFLRTNKRVTALLAPAVEKSFGNPEERESFYKTLNQIGFDTWIPVADEADVFAGLESEEWKARSEKEKIILSSSCPAAVCLIEREYPELLHLLSKTGSPMYLASKRAKENVPDARTVFIGPCVWKKTEREKQEEREGNADVVLTFEEFTELARLRKIKFFWNDKSLAWDAKKNVGLGNPGEGAGCVWRKMKEQGMERLPQFLHAAGLKACREILDEIRNGSCQNSYIELMACEKGCRPGGKAQKGNGEE